MDLGTRQSSANPQSSRWRRSKVTMQVSMAFSLCSKTGAEQSSGEVSLLVVGHRPCEDVNCNGIWRSDRYLGPRCSGYPVSDLYRTLPALGSPSHLPAAHWCVSLGEARIRAGGRQQ